MNAVSYPRDLADLLDWVRTDAEADLDAMLTADVLFGFLPDGRYVLIKGDDVLSAITFEKSLGFAYVNIPTAGTGEMLGMLLDLVSELDGIPAGTVIQ